MRIISRNEELVLATIWRLKGNAYGVTIRDALNELSDKEWSFGAVYMPLDKLTQKEYVRKYESAPTGVRGGRSKVMYELTEEGKKALNEVRLIQNALWKDMPDLAIEGKKNE